MKTVFKLTGVQRKKIVLFIADKDIYDVCFKFIYKIGDFFFYLTLNLKKKELFLEDISSLLTSGNIPDLFDNDELDSLFLDFKNDAIIEGVSDEKGEFYKFLIKVCNSILSIFILFKFYYYHYYFLIIWIESSD